MADLGLCIKALITFLTPTQGNSSKHIYNKGRYSDLFYNIEISSTRLENSVFCPFKIFLPQGAPILLGKNSFGLYIVKILEKDIGSIYSHVFRTHL